MVKQKQARKKLNSLNSKFLFLGILKDSLNSKSATNLQCVKIVILKEYNKILLQNLEIICLIKNMK